MYNNVSFIEYSSQDGESIQILRKYFSYWKELRKEKSLDTNYEDKIHNFLELIFKEKEKLAENKNSKIKAKLKKNHKIDDTSLEGQIIEAKMKNHIKQNGKNENRLQVQTHTIALLKAQLEQKNRVIDELKLKKIVEESNTTTDPVEDLKKKLIKCSISVKPKMKCVIGDSALNSSNSDFKIQCIKVPKFLQQMEQRARQRDEKRRIVAERRKQIEYEKERLREQMLLEKQIKDQDERAKIINEFKEKHKKEKLLAIKRKEFMEKYRGLCVMADLHFEKKLISKYGINAWKLFILRLKVDYQRAVNFDKTRLLRNHFNKWSKKVNQRINDRNMKADNLYCYKLKISIFKEMKKLHKNMLCKLYTAEDWYTTYITDKLFKIWRAHADQTKRLGKIRWNLAVLHYEKRLKWRFIGCWQTLPKIMSIEREQENRKLKWRIKVQQILPDFVPGMID